MKRLLVALISITLIATPLSALAAVKSGDLCRKVGSTATANGKKFTCIKSGKKLIWNKGVVVTKAAATPAPVITQFTSSPLNLCEIKETSKERQASGLFSGFPAMENYLPKKGIIRVLVVPIDWADLVGESDWEKRVTGQTSDFNEYWKMVTGNKLQFKWTVHKNWIRLPGASGDYSVPYSEANPETTRFFNQVLPTVDSEIDFSDFDIVHFIAPKSQNIIPETTQIAPSSMVNHPTKEGKIRAMTIVGKFFDERGAFSEPRTYWSYWAHELGHALELAHLGSPRGQFPMAGLELMGVQDGPSRTINGWTRFISGWLDADQVFCLPLERVKASEFQLRPIDGEGSGLKLIVVPISKSETLLIESRRETKFDVKDFENPRNGVFVYKYDAELGHLQNFLTPLEPSTSNQDANAWRGSTRYIMKEKDFVTYGGVEIEFVSRGGVDKIKINPAGPTPRPGTTPRPQPSPSSTDFNVVPEIAIGGISRTTEFTGEAVYWARGYNSYRIYVTKKSDPNSKPVFDTGYVNDYRYPIKVTIDNLTCSRDLLAVATLYSGLDGKGLSFSDTSQSGQLAIVDLKSDGKCQFAGSP
jgi:M6 family metalloprotease-like protein